MAKRALSTLGRLVREKRGPKKLRETATAIGISAPTLMRIEAGRVPDVATFGKVCNWLSIDPREFLGHAAKSAVASDQNFEPTVRVSAHFKADQLPLPETATALAKMLLFVAKHQAVSSLKVDDGDT